VYARKNFYDTIRSRVKKTPPPLTFLFLYIVLAFLLDRVVSLFRIADPYRILGIIPLFIGLGLNLWADTLYKKHKTTVKPDGIPSAFIGEGPFRFSRHPMYLGFVLILIGVAIELGSLSSFLAPVCMVITLEKKFIPQEEKHMETLFGPRYLDYTRRVRRWV
jgi:protein-S-isoprenylcysteine O-methyltransferase Ste14